MYNLQYEPWMSKLLTVNDHCRSIMIYPETWTYIQTPPTAWESWKQNLFEHSLRTKKPSNYCATKTIPNNICQANQKKNQMKRCLVLNVSKLRNIPQKKLCRKKKAHETASFDGFWFFQGQKFTMTCDRKSAWDFLYKTWQVTPTTTHPSRRRSIWHRYPKSCKTARPPDDIGETQDFDRWIFLKNSLGVGRSWRVNLWKYPIYIYIYILYIFDWWNILLNSWVLTVSFKNCEFRSEKHPKMFDLGTEDLDGWYHLQSRSKGLRGWGQQDPFQSEWRTLIQPSNKFQETLITLHDIAICIIYRSKNCLELLTTKTTNSTTNNQFNLSVDYDWNNPNTAVHRVHRSCCVVGQQNLAVRVRFIPINNRWLKLDVARNLSKFLIAQRTPCVLSKNAQAAVLHFTLILHITLPSKSSQHSELLVQKP